MAPDETRRADHGHRWTQAEDRIIYEAFILGKTQQAMSLTCGRSPTAVRRRLVRLGLIDESGRRDIDPPLFDHIRARFHAGAASGGDRLAREIDR